VRRDFEFPDADCVFTILSDGRRFAPWGLAGGGDGAPARFVLDPEGEARDLPSKVTLTIPKGGRVSVRTPGGGGFGDPRLRPRAAVEEDLRDGYVSLEKAREDYGFVPADTS
jgi:N-methylhydantoinase B